MIEPLLGTMSPSVIWAMIALALAVAELVVPGIFLIFLAIGAALTALVEFLVPMNAAFQMLLFSILSALTVSGGRLWYLARPASTDPLLNDRAAQLIGRPVTVLDAIVRGEGRVRVDDSSWRATGPDAPVGARMTVVEVDGATLVVSYPAA